ncbi:MAG TPA: hypothetical protein EYG92_12635 [Lutibacter sp.]|nr:hypothetical protein [Lutibacter sp.]
MSKKPSFLYDICLNEFTYLVAIFDSSVKEISQNLFFIGFPYNFPTDSEKLKALDNNSIKGYWSKIYIKDNEIEITQDLFGGNRLYYATKDTKTIISDDYQYIIQELGIVPELHQHEYTYWKKHRYTTGGSTLIQTLKKLPPATITIFNNVGIHTQTYFKDIIRSSDSKKHAEAIDADLKDTFKLIKQQNKKTILFFSGGSDSKLLLQYIEAYKIDFELVFLRIKPDNYYSETDFHKASSIAKQLGYKIHVIDVLLDSLSESEKENITKVQLFDRHFSLLHYLGIKKVTEKFGKDILIVNGQSSDSILSFGPSEKELFSYLRRLILYKPNNILAKLSIFPIRYMTKKKLVLPRTDKEKLLALYDETKYSRVVDNTFGKEYTQYLMEKVAIAIENLNSFYTKEMYVKIHSFIQGSDNQVVINSAKHYGFNNIIMPFATPQIVYSTIAFKDENLEIKKPKYVVEMLLYTRYKKLKPSNIKTKLKKAEANKLLTQPFSYYNKLLNKLELLK